MLTGSFLRLTAKGGVMLNIIPIMVWKGVEEQTAAFIYGFLLFLMVPLSLIFGWMADILPKNWILFSTSGRRHRVFLSADRFERLDLACLSLRVVIRSR